MDLPQQPSTGEVFVMRNAVNGRSLSYWLGREPSSNWETLCETIERCGGTVKRGPTDYGILHDVNKRAPIFTRDPGVPSNWIDEPKMFMSQKGVLKSEQRNLKALLKKEGLAEVEMLPGAVEGGNVVYDQHRHLMFVGVNNFRQQFLPVEMSRREVEIDGERYLERYDPNQFIRPEAKHRLFKERLKAAQPHAEWISAARDRFGQDDMTPNGKDKIRVVPLFIPDAELADFFHLDQVFNMLPSGQAIVYRPALSKAANHLIDKHIGKNNVIEVGRKDVMNDAINFITVGDRIITPYASDDLKKQFTKLGYTVIDPVTAGLYPGAWTYGEQGKGGAVRCLTLKLTPDHGFPKTMLAQRELT